MKKLLLLLLAIFNFQLSTCYACTNFLVGKAASDNGQTMITYAADSYSLYGFLRFQPAANHAKGEMRKVIDWDTDKYLCEIPEVEHAALEAPAATPDAWPQVDEALKALGIDAYRALYDALSAGETVGEGSRGDAARGLQQMLAAFGQDIRVDGIVGPRTIAALNAVQAQYGLAPSDKLDAGGLAALLPLLLTAEQGE